METSCTARKMAPGTLAALVVFALLAVPSMAGAENGWISGVVKDGSSGGSGLAAVTVSLVNTSWSTATDAEGRYNISAPAGNYTVKASATNYAEKTSGVVHVSANETTTYDTFLEKLKGSISGRITDNDDLKPVAGATVSLDNTPYTATTDNDGRYDIQGIDVGSYKWIVDPPSPYNDVNSTVTVKAGQNIIKDYKLKAPTKFTFVVRGGGGTFLLGATVTAKNNQAGLTYSTTTDVDGVAVLDVLPNAYVITVEADGYRQFITTYTIAKGEDKTYPLTLSKVSTGGGGGGLPVALIGGAAAVVVVVLVLVVILFMRKKKAPSGGPGAMPGMPQGQAESTEPGAPSGPKTQAQKMKEWADFERMYGRPHPEAPGWVSAGAAAAAAPKPKCPRDGSAVTYEPYSGMYFCSKCDERYTAEQVFRREDEVLEQSRPAEAAARAPGGEEPEKPAAGEKLDLSTAQPSWALEHGQTMTGEDYTGPGAGAPRDAATAPASGETPPPPSAAPMEAAPVSDDEPVVDAAVTTPEGVNPEAGPLFSMPKPIDYTDLPPPPAPKEPPKLE